MASWEIGLRMATADGTPSDMTLTVEADGLPKAVKAAVDEAFRQDPDLNYLDTILYTREG